MYSHDSFYSSKNIMKNICIHCCIWHKNIEDFAVPTARILQWDTVLHYANINDDDLNWKGKSAGFHHMAHI